LTTLLTRTEDRTATVPVQPTPAPAPPPPAAAPPTRPAVSRLVLTGELSQAEAAGLSSQLDALVRTGAPTVEVDLSGVQRMDVAVARQLLRASWHLGDPGRSLLLLHPRPQVHRVLRFVGAGTLVVR